MASRPRHHESVLSVELLVAVVEVIEHHRLLQSRPRARRAQDVAQALAVRLAAQAGGASHRGVAGEHRRHDRRVAEVDDRAPAELDVGRLEAVWIERMQHQRTVDGASAHPEQLRVGGPGRHRERGIGVEPTQARGDDRRIDRVAHARHQSGMRGRQARRDPCTVRVLVRFLGHHDAADMAPPSR
jgi:hypothetical protein